MRPLKLLYPFGFVYGQIVKIRNLFYDKGWFKSEIPAVYSICVGNLSVGGTGKTPMIEYLIELLLPEKKRIAVLSRGYKRKTKGFKQVDSKVTANDVGDEPFQMAQKFKKANFFVDEDRVEGAKKILEHYPKTDVLLLDDAFQHRKIKASLNILLTRFDQLYVDDYYLPAGYLRDHKSRAYQADIVIVTKCPEEFTNSEKMAIEVKLNLNNTQKLFFTGLDYSSAVQLFENSNQAHFESINALVITGIAQGEPFADYVSKKCHVLEHINYPDHYAFKSSDIAQWKNELIGFENAVIVTTEKDAVRLLSFRKELTGILVYYISIKTKFIGDKEKFDRIIGCNN